MIFSALSRTYTVDAVSSMLTGLTAPKVILDTSGHQFSPTSTIDDIEEPTGMTGYVRKTATWGQPQQASTGAPIVVQATSVEWDWTSGDAFEITGFGVVEVISTISYLVCGETFAEPVQMANTLNSVVVQPNIKMSLSVQS